MNGSMHCVECMPGCVGKLLSSNMFIQLLYDIANDCQYKYIVSLSILGMEVDECNMNGNNSDSCGKDRICVAQGVFSARKCLRPSE